MTMLTTEIRADDDDVHVVYAVGELDLRTAGDLRSVLRAIPLDSGLPLTIDVSGVTFCDSTGLAELVDAPGPRPVRLRAPSELLVRLLTLTGTETLFQIEP